MKFLAISALILSAAITVPATAQSTNMGTDPGMTSPPTSAEHLKPTKPGHKMTEADMKKWDACKAMSHENMLKDAKCVRMAKMHPDMGVNPPM
jgi:hypothetical protein